MEALQAIMTRRSIRKFTSQVVSEEMIDQILKAGMQAPSANNGQPWHFIVFQDRAKLDEIPAIHPYAQMAKEAPLAILVCADLTDAKSPDYWMVDCSAATQNILLAAHALGLGAVWCGVYPRQQRMDGMTTLAGLPEKVMPLSLIILGYPAELPQSADRFKPERIHHERW